MCCNFVQRKLVKSAWKQQEQQTYIHSTWDGLHSTGGLLCYFTSTWERLLYAVQTIYCTGWLRPTQWCIYLPFYWLSLSNCWHFIKGYYQGLAIALATSKSWLQLAHHWRFPSNSSCIDLNPGALLKLVSLSPILNHLFYLELYKLYIGKASRDWWLVYWLDRPKTIQFICFAAYMPTILLRAKMERFGFVAKGLGPEKRPSTMETAWFPRKFPIATVTASERCIYV